MSKNSPVGLSLDEIYAETLASLDGEATDASTSVTEEKPNELSTEHPAEQNEEDEQVDLFADLDDSDPDNEEDEQPEGDSTSFVVEGQTVSLEELRKGYLRQSDYTKKTQELASEKEELANAKALWDSLQSDYNGTLARLQRAALSGQTKPQVPAKPQGTEDVDALVAAKVQELLAADPRLVELQELKEQKELDDSFATIEADFEKKLTANDRQRVLDEMETLGVSGPVAMRRVFAGLLQEAELAAKRRKNVAATSTASGRSGGSARQLDPKDIPASIFEAYEQQVAEEKLRSKR